MNLYPELVFTVTRFVAVFDIYYKLMVAYRLGPSRLKIRRFTAE
jgi:hypothetical protein